MSEQPAHCNAAAAAWCSIFANMPFASQQQHREANNCIDAEESLHAACKEADWIAKQNNRSENELSRHLNRSSIFRNSIKVDEALRLVCHISKGSIQQG
jgi:hypothetical protein